MMEEKIEFEQECPECKGTGIYKGMAERDGYGVVCHKCGGTGMVTFVHKYNKFTGRKPVSGINVVLEANPGIFVGGSGGFGGISYDEWVSGTPFVKGTEMRNYTCPAWWFQSVDYEKKPDWDECLGCGSFGNCPSFKNKHLCWKRHDEEFK